METLLRYLISLFTVTHIFGFFKLFLINYTYCMFNGLLLSKLELFTEKMARRLQKACIKRPPQDNKQRSK